MGLIILLVVLVLLFGGGGFYYGPPYHYYGGGLGLVLLIVVLVLLFRGEPNSAESQRRGSLPSLSSTSFKPTAQPIVSPRDDPALIVVL